MCGLQPSLAAAEPQEPKTLLTPPVQLAAIAAMALYLHAICWWMRPPDMGIFLEPWLAHIVHYGPLEAFSHPFSNYEPAYLYLLAALSLAHGLIAPMYLIKALSIAGTGFLTIAVADLLKACGSEAKHALFVLILPTAIINAALLGQCDALWGGSCVLAVAAMIRGRTVQSLVWCGVAFAFKDSGGRTTQIYISLRDNSYQDAQGFRPFGEVVEGMDVADALNSEYGETSGGGIRAGNQQPLFDGGNAFLDRAFPRLDRIMTGRVIR